MAVVVVVDRQFMGTGHWTECRNNIESPGHVAPFRAGQDENQLEHETARVQLPSRCRGRRHNHTLAGIPSAFYLTSGRRKQTVNWQLNQRVSWTLKAWKNQLWARQSRQVVVYCHVEVIANEKHKAGKCAVRVLTDH